MCFKFKQTDYAFIFFYAKYIRVNTSDSVTLFTQHFDNYSNLDFRFSKLIVD
jgi:hypothetical protein